jgi:hypothetical protein
MRKQAVGTWLRKRALLKRLAAADFQDALDELGRELTKTEATAAS